MTDRIDWAAFLGRLIFTVTEATSGTEPELCCPFKDACLATICELPALRSSTLLEYDYFCHVDRLLFYSTN